MNSFKSYFTFTRHERHGLIVLVALILSLQLCYYFVDFSTAEANPVAKRQWLALQKQIDSVEKLRPQPKHYPFNPNFITDYKGYRLGMSVAEIDRLHDFRKAGRFVNSADEFQQVTKVSDSLLAVLAPDFKFPEWVSKRTQANRMHDARIGGQADGRWLQTGARRQTAGRVNNKVVVKDINAATKEDLMAVYGIGDALSDRILKQKELLGGFVSMAQMADVWGLSDEVVEKLNVQFKVFGAPQVRKIPVNDASLNELAKFPYFRYALAKEIVTFRSMNGKISSSADLIKIRNFPVDKVEIIAVYLEF